MRGAYAGKPPVIHAYVVIQSSPVKISKHMVRGKERFVLDFGTRHGARHRESFPTEEEALKAKAKAEKELALAGRWWAMLPEKDKQEMIAVFKQMREHGLHPEDVWQGYLTGEGTVKQRRTLKEAIAETLQAKKEANRKARSLRALENYLNRFARGRETTAVDRIATVDIEEWFSKRNEAPSTKKSNLGRLSALFALCQRRGYLAKNPCEAIDATIVDQKPAVILSFRECQRMLKVCRKHCPALLPYIVLCLLAGCRPEEVQHMDWKAIDLRRKRLTINYDTTKVRRWRIVDLPKPAISFLRKCVQEWPAIAQNCPTASRKPSGRVSPPFTTLRRLRRRLRDKLGMKTWTADILRHTFGSHLLAYTKDPKEVADLMGTSQKMLYRHYRKLVTYEDGEKFMGIKP